MADTFETVIEQLVEEIEGLRNSINHLMRSASINIRLNRGKINRFLEENGERVDNGSNENQTYKFGPEFFGQVRRLYRQQASSIIAANLLPGSLLVTLVSRYDAFLGRLIGRMVLICPDMLKASDRTLSLGRLIELGDFEAAKGYLIEKEIESVLRKSHKEHFEWLEKKLKIPLRADLPSWKTFIELTERRNLLVHCDGIVSHQYLANCKEHSVPVGTCSVGDKLGVPPDYFRAACDCILEMGVKLTHVVWRKLLYTDCKSADEALNNTCLELLSHENFALANELLRFANTTFKNKHANDRIRLIYLINWAQSYKWLNKDSECQKLLDQEDWSAKVPEYRLCVDVLRERYDRAAILMKDLGPNGAIRAENYREWPVFRLARKEKVFIDTYKEIFGEEMELGESSDPRTNADIAAYLETLWASEIAKKSMQASQPENDEPVNSELPESGLGGDD